MFYSPYAYHCVISSYFYEFGGQVEISGHRHPTNVGVHLGSGLRRCPSPPPGEILPISCRQPFGGGQDFGGGHGCNMSAVDAGSMHFPCTTCGSRFSRRENLTRHRKTRETSSRRYNVVLF